MPVKISKNVRKKPVFVQERSFTKPPTLLTKIIKAGFLVVRRSNCLWAGLSMDLVIEHVLMTNLRKSSGLTRACGMTEKQSDLTYLYARMCRD